jgi:hypothetical protein
LGIAALEEMVASMMGHMMSAPMLGKGAVAHTYSIIKNVNKAMRYETLHLFTRGTIPNFGGLG